MGLNMKERKAVIKETCGRYRKSRKKEKGQILDEFIKLTRYNRKYAGWILRNWGRKVWIRSNGELIEIIAGIPENKRKRNKKPKKYDSEVIITLKKIWYMFDCLCGKRLAPILRSMLPILEKFHEIEISETVKEKLLTISPATIDRALRKEKKKLVIKGRSYTKPGTLLKHNIPIRTFNDWDEDKPGYVEIDLVGHEGSNSSGDFCFTLTVTDICSSWTEVRGLKNKAEKWTFLALMDVKKNLPFDILGIDSDNGSEFINAHLYRYCKKHNITFTRSRPYRKNDNCFVEQKNNSLVRRTVGYLRYDTDEELAKLNELYENLNLSVNFFYPSMKLIEKMRKGSKVKKKYDVPRTPCQRLLESEYIPEITKAKLKDQFESLNPAELKRNITRLQNQLIQIASNKGKISFQGGYSILPDFTA